VAVVTLFVITKPYFSKNITKSFINMENYIKRRLVPKPKILGLFSVLASATFGLNVNAQEESLISSLKSASIPTPENLSTYVKNESSLVALGKALFWDNEAGFKGQACASCHYHAGVDSRYKNQISPNGASNISGFDSMQTGQGGPNYTLKVDDFPLFELSNPDDRHSQIIYDTDDTVTSMGTYLASVSNVNGEITGQDDECNIEPDITFHVNGYNTRRVEPRNTPSTINAVFNFRQFWDGRANNEFNGVDPFGPRSQNAIIRRNDGGSNYTNVRVSMRNSSLASQAVGPILSTLEMNCAGRQISHVARKLLPKQPLERQFVSSTDSVLGSLANSDLGLNTSYRQLVQESFRDEWWNGTADINGFSQIESNFSLFYGLALQAYQSTLISDDSPFDRYMDGDSNALNSQEQQGLAVFLGKGNCTACHKGPELSSAASRLQSENSEGGLVERMQMAKLDGGPIRVVENWEQCSTSQGLCRGNNVDVRTYRWVSNDGTVSETRSTQFSAWCYAWYFGAPGSSNTLGHCEVLNGTTEEAEGFVALYDNGFYNIGVTPTIEDLGVGADDPWGNPLSWTRQEKFRAAGLSDLAPDNFFTDPNRFEENPGVPVDPNERDAVDGAFKTPILRNVSLTAPYMHNGDQLTLEQLVEFYNRGGNRQDTSGNDDDGSRCDTTGFAENCSNLDPDITSLDLTETEKAALVAFIRALTDERVREESAPFDHPELIIPLGHVGDENFVETVFENGATIARDDLFTLPAVGREGRSAIGLTPIPEVQELIACGESNSIKNCFTTFYGDATEVASRPAPTPENWEQCATAPGICAHNGTTRTYRFVYPDGSTSPTRDYRWNAWCYEWFFTGSGSSSGHCEVLNN
jgi:cytochrome c peroxidase